MIGSVSGKDVRHPGRRWRTSFLQSDLVADSAWFYIFARVSKKQA
jgi:hypothetical protein